MNVLEQIVSDSRHRVARRRRRPGVFSAALREPGVSVIAEHKRRSPSAGEIREDLSLEQVVAAYERGGARCLSILTEESRFGGNLQDIRRTREVTDLPVLRKDFIVEPFQVAEAAVNRADAILLIVAALEPGPLARLYRLAQELDLDVLVEVHNHRELEVALQIGAKIIGINNRNLATLDVDLQTTYDLLPLIPEGVIKVAESGFSKRSEINELRAAGVDGVLIGEALMRSRDLEVACKELTR